MDEEINLRLELANIVRKEATAIKSKESRRKKEDQDIRERILKVHTEEEGDFLPGSWQSQLKHLFIELEQNPKDKSIVNKLKFGNHINMKKMNKDTKGYYSNHVISISILEQIMETKKLNILEALAVAAKPGKRYSQYNFIHTDAERIEGKKAMQRREREVKVPKVRRPRGEGRVKRILSTVKGSQKGTQERNSIIFRANGKGLNTISEANLDKNGVSFASSVTNSLLTHRHTTREVNFFKKARVTTFKKEAKPEIVENVFELKREGVSIEDAKHEVRKRKPERDEEEEEEFLLKIEKPVNTKDEDKLHKQCMFCWVIFQERVIQESKSMSRHLQKSHQQSFKIEEVKDKKHMQSLTPVVKIEHREQEERRPDKMKLKGEIDIETARLYLEKYIKRQI